MQDLVRTSAPATTPVSLADAKVSLRVDHEEEDGLIGLHIDAATRILDGPHGELKRCLVDQTWRESFERFPADGPIELSLRPLIAVVEIKYRSAAGQLVTLPADQYIAHDGELALIEPPIGGAFPECLPGLRAVQVTFRCGYAADALPDEAKTAILLMVGDLYANRETGVVGTVASEVKMTPTVRRLLSGLWVPAR